MRQLRMTHKATTDLKNRAALDPRLSLAETSDGLRCRGRKAQKFADSAEVGMNSGLVRAFVGTPFPIQKQGLYNLLAVTIANRLQWCASSERWNLHVNPVLGLLLNDLLQSAFRLWITKKSLFEFVVLFRLGIIPSGGHSPASRPPFACLYFAA